jgi:hypothetical protein
MATEFVLLVCSHVVLHLTLLCLVLWSHLWRILRTVERVLKLVVSLEGSKCDPRKTIFLHDSVSEAYIHYIPWIQNQSKRL